MVGLLVVAACAGDDAAPPAVAAVEGPAPISTVAPSTTARAAAASTMVGEPRMSPSSSGPSTAVESADSFDVGTSPCRGEALAAAAAFDSRSGRVEWSVCSTDPVYRSMVAAMDRVVYLSVFADEVSDLVALDARDGAELWRLPVVSSGSPGSGWPKGAFAGGGAVVLVLADETSQAPMLAGVDAIIGVVRANSTLVQPII